MEMTRDRIIGILMVVGSVLGAILYGWLVFASPWSTIIIQLTMFILILILCVVIGWMGYVLATTKPPLVSEKAESIPNPAEIDMKK